MDDIALDPDAVLWSAPEGARRDHPLLVLLHGYGADENDLFGLASALGDGFTVAAVRAPQAPPWPAPGYSWYPIDDVLADDITDGDPSRVTRAASAFLDWLDAAAGPDQTTGLLGFSQGASVALQALRLRPARFAFTVVLSGYATPGDLPGDAELTAKTVPVFWGRGASDDVIPHFFIEHTAQWLPAHSALSGRVYAGLGHGVSDEEVGDVRVFLDRHAVARD